ncbi:MAG: ImmA/IrrE family metallo-endopeptidase [Sphingopyxis sp.]|uniref:helix-turn-helix domain-containing protein n=1 Tax=Sphingopyxis sp. TaxID=1908224 RepID=UPI001A5C5D88|nr:XRE family transcriptional regulator [Sphingopyxis sp.]MBL9065007.1 ImmA/IrrE family metallo-endopeptidase [Sphingopyxis sp.]
MPKVNPDILRWAREQAGLDLEAAARELGLTGKNATAHLEELEVGEKDPSRSQLANMARKYRRPLLTFFLEAPPKLAERTHDYRMVVDPEPGHENILGALVRENLTRQALVRTALEDADEAAKRDFVGSLSMNQGSAAGVVALEKLLEIDRDDYRRAKSTDDAFGVLRDAAERAGVFVVLQGNLGNYFSDIGPDVFRGLSLVDDVAPFIVINDKDARAAWSFTLLHEIVHILLGEGGISGYASGAAIERFCDDVASLFLLDPGELDQIEIRDWSVDNVLLAIGNFSTPRNLSRKMVAYNLYRGGQITLIQFRELSARLDQERLDRKAAERKGQVDYYVVRRHRIGPGLVGLVDRMVGDGWMTSVKAARVLGVKPTAIGRMTEAA